MELLYIRSESFDNDHTYIDLGPEALMIDRIFSKRHDIKFIDTGGNVTNIRRALETAHHLFVFHISAHGNPRGIVLEDSRGSGTHEVSADELISFIRQRAPRLLVLAACQSMILAREVLPLGLVPHVIAT